MPQTFAVYSFPENLVTHEDRNKSRISKTVRQNQNI